MTDKISDAAPSHLTRPIIGIENRSAQEVFDIMCDRFSVYRTAANPLREVLEKFPVLTDEVLERACKAADPDLFSDDERTAHTAASPLSITYARNYLCARIRNALLSALESTPAPVSEITEEMVEASCPGCRGTGDQGGNPSYGVCDDCGGSGKFIQPLPAAMGGE